MTQDIVIRDSEPGDLPAITAIYAGHVRDGTASFELTPPGELEMAQRRENVLEAGLPHLVAELEDRIAGYAYAGPYRTRPAYAGTVEDSVYLDDWAAGRGIGRELLAAVIARCTLAGRRQMVAVIGDTENRASIRLHELMGFRLVGVLENVGYKHGRWLDTVIMQRALGDGAETPPG